MAKTISNTKTNKSKARDLQNWTALQISELLNLPWGRDELIAPREMGQAGVDIRLIGEARLRFPFSVECKNHKKWNVQNFIAQAKSNQLPGTDWLLVLKKTDRSPKERISPVVVLDAAVFFDILRGLYAQEEVEASPQTQERNQNSKRSSST